MRKLNQELIKDNSFDKQIMDGIDKKVVEYLKQESIENENG